MRAIQLLPLASDPPTGLDVFVEALAAALAEAGTDGEIVSVGRPPPRLAGAPGHRFFANDLGTWPVLNRLLVSRALRQELAATPADIVHVHGLWSVAGTYAGRQRQGRRPATVISVHGMLSASALAYSPLRKRLFWLLAQRRALSRATVIHATSEAEATDIRRAGIRTPIALLPPGIDVPATVAPPAGRERTILFLGRFHPIKGLDRLLRAWAEVAPQRPDWTLCLQGPDEGGYRLELERLAGREAIRNVVFADAVYGTAKAERLASASLLVLPSLSENFSLVVAEALAAGLPVVASRGTPWQGLAARQCGWWVDNEPGPLAHALLEATSLSTERLCAMGLNGRQWIVSDFAWPAVARRMQAIYEWAARGGDRPATILAD